MRNKEKQKYNVFGTKEIKLASEEYPEMVHCRKQVNKASYLTSILPCPLYGLPMTL